MAKLTDIPNEILLQFFSHMPLKALIAARGVNKHWRQLVPHADILTARRALLDLYLNMLKSRFFLRTRSSIVNRLQPFDRQGYLYMLLEQHQYLPEDFCTWVLEWPARATIRGTWPGLPVNGPDDHINDYAGMTSGNNWLGSDTPELSAIHFGPYPPYEVIPALCLWSETGEFTWLVLDERHGLCGKVYQLYRDGNKLFTEDGCDKYDTVYANFIDWQKRLWRKMEAEEAFRAARGEAGSSGVTGSLALSEIQPRRIPRIPAAPWRERHESGI